MNQFDSRINTLQEVMDYIDGMGEFLSYERIPPEVLKEIQKRFKKEYKKLTNEDYENMNYLTEEAKDAQ